MFKVSFLSSTSTAVSRISLISASLLEMVSAINKDLTGPGLSRSMAFLRRLFSSLSKACSRLTVALSSLLSVVMLMLAVFLDLSPVSTLSELGVMVSDRAGSCEACLGALGAEKLLVLTESIMTCQT